MCCKENPENITPREDGLGYSNVYYGISVRRTICSGWCVGIVQIAEQRIALAATSGGIDFDYHFDHFLGVIDGYVSICIKEIFFVSLCPGDWIDCTDVPSF